MSSNSPTVLIVEDEVMLQDVYKLVLETKGFRVFTANNGQEALDKLTEVSPSIILLDMLMPIMSGKEFMLQFDQTQHPQAKVIVYSNLSDSLVEAEMLDLGAERFILKSSLTPAALVEAIQAV